MPQVILVSREELAQEKWWTKLDPAEQRTVLLETQELTQVLVVWEKSRLGMGKHFKALQEVLEPKRIFVRYCRRFSRLFSIRTIGTNIADSANMVSWSCRDRAVKIIDFAINSLYSSRQSGTCAEVDDRNGQREKPRANPLGLFI